MTLPSHVRKLTGDEALRGAQPPDSNGTVLDFWRWAFSDLSDNVLRGVFAEWLVGTLLGCPLTVRNGWAVHDLETPEGWRIEVKSGAYRQSWHTERSRESRIVFSRLASVAWDPEIGYVGDRALHADAYVFCVQLSRTLAEYDAFDLGQWSFYVATRDRLEREAARSI